MCSFQASRSPDDLALDIIDNSEGDCLLKFVAREDLYTDDELKIIAESYQALVESFSSEPHVPLSQPSMHKPEDIAQAMSFSKGKKYLRSVFWNAILTTSRAYVCPPVAEDVARSRRRYSDRISRKQGRSIRRG